MRTLKQKKISTSGLTVLIYGETQGGVDALRNFLPELPGV
jgi:hypothetical protein